MATDPEFLKGSFVKSSISCSSIPNSRFILDSTPLLSCRAEKPCSSKRTQDRFANDNAFLSSSSFFHQFRALLYQRVAIQIRRYGTNICQLLLPFFIIFIIGIMQLIANSIVNQTNLIGSRSDIFPLPIEMNFSVPCLLDLSLHNRPLDCTNDFRVLKQILVNSADCHFLKDFLIEMNPLFLNIKYIDCSNPERLYKLLPQYSLYELPFFYFTSNITSKSLIGNLDFNGVQNGFLGSLFENQYFFSLEFVVNPRFNDPFFNDHVIFSNHSTKNIFLPFVINLNTSNSDASLLRIYDAMIYYQNLSQNNGDSIDEFYQKFKSSPTNQYQYFNILKHVKRKNFTFVQPFGALHLYDLNSTSIDLLIISPDFQLSLINYETHRSNQILNQISNSYFFSMSNFSSTTHIATWIFPIPARGDSLQLNFFELAGNFLFPLLTSFISPLYIDILVSEKEGNHLIMMKLCTLRENSYLLSTFIYFFSVYVIIMVPVILSSLVFELRIMMHSSTLLLLFVFVNWGCAQVILSFLFSIFFVRTRSATNIAYFIVVLGVVISFLVNLLSIIPLDQFPFIYMLYPPFAYYRIIYLLNLRCQQFLCYQQKIMFIWDSLAQSIFFLFIGSVLFLVSSLYLFIVLPNEFRHGETPFFFVQYLFKLLSIHSKVSKLFLPFLCSGNHSDVFKNGDYGSIFNLNHDGNSNYLKHSPICIYRLRKVFKAGNGWHVAVKCFSIKIPTNECFGLLGANGAGKTTLISMLTGFVTPSSGTAILNGYSLNNNIFEIYRKLGYCPQNEILFNDLTCAEHVLFYSRLKGVKIKYERAILNFTLGVTELFEKRSVKSINLSGGFRRRLSLALSVINDPNILIFDEPTTGLDPISRIHVWDLIKRWTRDRAIILTTHNMEEADILCSKVGIMHYGILRALGTQFQLKHLYSQGYLIKICANPISFSDIQKYIITNLPMSIHIENDCGYIFYRLPHKGFSINCLLQVFVDLKKLSLIKDWEMKSANLDEVLDNVAYFDVDERNILLRKFPNNTLSKLRF